MDWITTTLFWYGHLFLLGLIFFPLTKKFFSKFFDYGYGLSKTVGIVVTSYLAFIIGIFHLSSFSQILLYGILFILGVFNFYLFWKDQDLNDLIHAPLKKTFFLFFEEALFLISIMWLAYVRGQEPSIHGLEKFMDFGFINSVLHSQQFPPLDMWYSAGPNLAGAVHPNGFAINYYYFGHLTGAFLIKLTGVSPYFGYNLILATIFAQGVTASFSLISTIVHFVQKTVEKSKYSIIHTYLFGLLGAYIVNLAGNLHTVYLFTKGYTNETPVPFWHIWSIFNPSHYWYPNATRFIPFTIHEFPAYSYIVADLHGHVFDIPFVLLTVSLLFSLYISKKMLYKVETKHGVHYELEKDTAPSMIEKFSLDGVKQFLRKTVVSRDGGFIAVIGFMTAIHYMTNAFDGPIYILLAAVVITFIYKISHRSLLYILIIGIAFVVFSRPFSANFSLFASGVGVNCPPEFIFSNQASHIADGTSALFKVGPFLFEKGNCQKSEPWMMFVLWGFFWINALILAAMKLKEFLENRNNKDMHEQHTTKTSPTKFLFPDIEIKLNDLDIFALILFLFSTFLIIIPEFFYAKDIYPAHFRANTMFKLGYQAFMMMGIASTYVIYRLRTFATGINPWLTKLLPFSIISSYGIIFAHPVPPEKIANYVGPSYEYLLIIPFIILWMLIILYVRNSRAIISLVCIFIVSHILTLVVVYPFYGFPSYYGNLQKTDQEKKEQNIQTDLNGIKWLKDLYPGDLEIINFIDNNVTGQPVVLEAPGDSYTDYERISANTGLPTVVGWSVHEWLWRGSFEVAGKRIADIDNIYQSQDVELTKQLLKKYHIEYIVLSDLERKKYLQINEKKIETLGTKVFQSSNGSGALYQLK